MQDCSDVMQLLLKTQTDMADLADDDPQVNILILFTQAGQSKQNIPGSDCS